MSKTIRSTEGDPFAQLATALGLPTLTEQQEARKRAARELRAKARQADIDAAARLKRSQSLRKGKGTRGPAVARPRLEA